MEGYLSWVILFLSNHDMQLGKRTSHLNQNRYYEIQPLICKKENSAIYLQKWLTSRVAKGLAGGMKRNPNLDILGM